MQRAIAEVGEAEREKRARKIKAQAELDAAPRSCPRRLKRLNYAACR